MRSYSYSFVLAAASVAILSSCTDTLQERATKNEDAVTVTVATAESHPARIIQGSGQITAGETAMISTRVMGIITRIHVRPGDRVQRGQSLVAISNAEMMAKRAQAAALLSEAEAAQRDAQKDYERYTELFKQQSASQKELENVTLHYQAVKAKTDAARQMQQEADAMLAYTNLTAPFAGVITQKYVDAGSMANPGMPILVIEQSGNFQVNTSVTEADIGRVTAGAPARVTVESIGKTFTGTVSEVSPSSQMSGGRYYVKVTLPADANGELHAGMYTNVSIETPAAAAAGHTLMVPVKAIVERDQLHGLYIVRDDHTARLRWVTLGKRQDEQVEVLSGLTGGEQFVLSANNRLYNGVPVVIQ